MARKKNNSNKKKRSQVNNGGPPDDTTASVAASNPKGNVFGGANMDSMVNLTKPQLYSIYDEDITRSEDPDTILERSGNTPSSFAERSSLSTGPQSAFLSLPNSGNALGSSGSNVSRQNSVTSINFKKPWYRSVVRILYIASVLSLSGIGYHELSTHLHDNHLLHPELASKPLLLFVQISKSLSNGMLPDWVGYAMEGIIFGLLIPFFDHLFQIQTSTSTSSIIRSVNSMLGVTFGVRKIEWSSSLQASGAWGLLNIILWLLFDATISMLMSCAALGFFVCAIGYKDITDISQLLYFMDFYFLGMMLFGKLGRYLLSH